MHRRIAAALTATALALTAVVLAAPAAQAAEVRLSIMTANADGPDNRPRYSYSLQPGQHVQDYVAIRNGGSTTQTVRLYATDAHTAADGSFYLNTAAEPAGDLGTWALFTPTSGAIPTLTLEIAPGATEVIPFRLDAPAGAAPGDHVGGIVASVPQTDGQLAIDHRVAIPIYARVAGELRPALAIGGLDARWHGDWNPLAGTVRLELTIVNSGNVALDGQIHAGVDGAFGALADADARSIGELLPGSSRVVAIEIPGVAQAGPITARVRLQPFATEEGSDPGAVPEVFREAPLLVIPWAALGVLLLVAAVVAVLIWRRRRTSTRHEQELAAAREAGRREALAAANPEEDDR